MMCSIRREADQGFEMTGTSSGPATLLSKARKLDERFKRRRRDHKLQRVRQEQKHAHRDQIGEVHQLCQTYCHRSQNKPCHRCLVD